MIDTPNHNYLLYFFGKKKGKPSWEKNHINNSVTIKNISK